MHINIREEVFCSIQKLIKFEVHFYVIPIKQLTKVQRPRFIGPKTVNILLKHDYFSLYKILNSAMKKLYLQPKNCSINSSLCYHQWD